jgi:uridine kinase
MSTKGATAADVVDHLARILAERADRTIDQVLRVALTGITASGKSSLALALTRRLTDMGRACVRLPVDGFHNPRAIRYRRGRESAEGYYRDAYYYELLLAHVLRPLGPGGNRSYLAQAFDLETDTPVQAQPIVVEAGSIAILDASFLLRPEIRDHFDYRIFVQASFEVAEDRGVARDQESLGGIAEARRLYRQRYHEAQRIYFREAEPLKHVDALVVNDDLAHPVLFVRHEQALP